MMLPLLKTAQARDFALIQAVLNLPDNALSVAIDAQNRVDEEWVRSVGVTLRDFPFLLALDAEQCVGFAYARPHCAGAYRWSADVALHVDPQGSAPMVERLYRQVLRDLAAQGYLAAYARVSPSNQRAVALHETLGFVRIGAHPCIDLQQDVDCWCLSLGDRHPVHEPMSFQALVRARRSSVAG